MGQRREILRSVSRELGKRRLIWAGLRADDIDSLQDLQNLDGSFCIIGGAESSVPSTTYECLSGVRMDVDHWDIEDHSDAPETREFRIAMLNALMGETALFPYRSSGFLSSVYFARRPGCLFLGLSGAHQSAFEHKPWVETELAAHGVAGVPWVYIPDIEDPRVAQLLDSGPILVRRSRTSGGVGFRYVESFDDLTDGWPISTGELLGVTPYLSGTLPLNVGATVWRDGVTVGRVSVQLIGVAECTDRPFGYCGNDFGRARKLDAEILDGVEARTEEIGYWLRAYGYRGTFGVDYLVSGGHLLFTEVNPRFQGSTHADARLSAEAGEGCLFLDHIAACLDLPAPSRPCLRSQMSVTPDWSHVVVHWLGETTNGLEPAPLVKALGAPGVVERWDVLTRPSLTSEKGSVVGRVTLRREVTSTGFQIADDIARPIRTWQNESMANTPGYQ